MTDQKALIVLLSKSADAQAVQQAFAALGLEVSLLNALPTQALFRSAVEGDTSAAKMWLINRAAEDWSAKSLRQKPGRDGKPAKNAQAEDDPLDNLRLVG